MIYLPHPQFKFFDSITADLVGVVKGTGTDCASIEAYEMDVTAISEKFKKAICERSYQGRKVLGFLREDGAEFGVSFDSNVPVRIFGFYTLPPHLEFYKYTNLPVDMFPFLDWLETIQVSQI